MLREKGEKTSLLPLADAVYARKIARTLAGGAESRVSSRFVRRRSRSRYNNARYDVTQQVREATMTTIAMRLR